MTKVLETDSLLATLAELRQLSPEIRFGQMLANLGFLCEDRTGHSLSDVDDHDLLDVMEEHRADLARREQPIS